jgi:hypothetical protein
MNFFGVMVGMELVLVTGNKVPFAIIGWKANPSGRREDIVLPSLAEQCVLFYSHFEFRGRGGGGARLRTHCTKYYCSAKRKHKLRSPIVCTSSSEKNRQNLYHVLVEEKWSQRQARVTCEHQESKTVGSRATRFYHLPLYFRQKQTSRESPTPPTSKQVHMFESTKLQNLLASATQSSAWRWSGWLIGSNDLILEERDQML